jgi:membrane-associated phospholipid phosphatase
MNGLLAWDNRITLGLYDWGAAHQFVQRLFLYAAVVAVYALPIVLIWLFWRNRGSDRRVSIKIFLAAVVVWRVLSQVLGSLLYGQYGFRNRPFNQRGLQEFFFEQPQKAFPSDHAAVLTTVACLFLIYRYPRLGWFFVAALIVTAFGRVVVGFHYVGDILGGVTLGIVMTGVMVVLDRFFERLFDRWQLNKGTNDQGQ